MISCIHVSMMTHWWSVCCCNPSKCSSFFLSCCTNPSPPWHTLPCNTDPTTSCYQVQPPCTVLHTKYTLVLYYVITPVPQPSYALQTQHFIQRYHTSHRTPISDPSVHTIHETMEPVRCINFNQIATVITDKPEILNPIFEMRKNVLTYTASWISERHPPLLCICGNGCLTHPQSFPYNSWDILQIGLSSWVEWD